MEEENSIYYNRSGRFDNRERERRGVREDRGFIDDGGEKKYK